MAKIFSIVTKFDLTGGATLFATDLHSELLGDKNSGYFIFGQTSNLSEELFSSLKYPFLQIDSLVRDFSLSDILTVLRLRRLFHIHRPSLVVSHSFKACLLSRIAIAFLNPDYRPSFVQVVHGFSFPHSRLFHRLIYFLFEYILQHFTTCTAFVSKADLLTYKKSCQELDLFIFLFILIPPIFLHLNHLLISLILLK